MRLAAVTPRLRSWHGVGARSASFMVAFAFFWCALLGSRSTSAGLMGGVLDWSTRCRVREYHLGCIRKGTTLLLRPGPQRGSGGAFRRGRVGDSGAGGELLCWGVEATRPAWRRRTATPSGRGASRRFSFAGTLRRIGLRGESLCERREARCAERASGEAAGGVDGDDAPRGSGVAMGHGEVVVRRTAVLELRGESGWGGVSFLGAVGRAPPA